MNNSIACYAITALLLSFSPQGYAAPAAPAKPFHITGKVVMPDGKPAAGAIVTLLIGDEKTNQVIVRKTATLDASGAYDLVPSKLPPPGHSHWASVLYAKSAQGIAICTFGPEPSVLAPFTRLSLHLKDDQGKPVAHVRLSPAAFHREKSYLGWSKIGGNGWSVVTNAQGDAVLPNLPQGYEMNIRVDDTRFAQLNWKSQITLAAAAQTPDKTITLAYGGGIAGAVRFQDGKPGAGVTVQATELGDDATGTGSIQTDSQGGYSFSGLPIGLYNVEILTEKGYWQASNDPKNPHWENWTAAARTAVMTRKGKTIPGVDLTLTHGALISGRVLDKSKGTPIAGASVNVSGPAHPSNSRFSMGVQTGADGSYEIRVPAGRQSVSVYVNGSDEYNETQETQVADGETKTIDFQVAAAKPQVAISGVVVGPDGAPVAGAEVSLQDYTRQPAKQITDAQGKFAFEPSFANSDTWLYARSDSLATSMVQAPEDGSAVTLKLAENNLCVFQGQVSDQEGKPIPHIKVALIRWTQNHGGSDVASVTTDESGRYAFPPDLSGAKYSVRAEAAGYATKYSDNLATISGKTVDIPSLVLVKADSFAGGVVLDPKGKPVADAKVRCYDLKNLEVITDKNGRFHLAGVPRDNTRVGVEAPEERRASVQISSGSDDNEITVKSRAEQEEEGKRYVALRDADTTNHGDGRDAHVLLKAAQDKAGAEGKSVLLVFHATWCGPCFMLHRYLEDPKVKQVLDKHFVVQDLDIWENDDKKKYENPGGADIYKQYGGPSSIPFYVALDPQGKKLGDSIHHGENMGMSTSSGDVQFFLDTLKQAQPALTTAEIALLKAELKQHASL
ncbi:MAG: carboxypeptidase regulatory-like domain-containing protein [Capsulimonas sp.]|uniref:carboxypeptidase regulatory-like domain-containing protein n=1 Tax=Capsulimonas sp. TaxID=2494211 RepID=UPI003266A551